jgi:hypothetical protein
MTSIPVETLISKLDHWISLLTTVRFSLQTQVSLLDSALSNLRISQPSSQVIQYIQPVQAALAHQLSKVLREISDLELARNLLVTNPPNTEAFYEHIFRLSDRRNSLNHRATY